eukprot:CAMPEP_0197553586 /NCGR_PEP_ID=MMETSP1320-20131121/9319_1 /TAXON_ID=91990 /ORGANISM="Bolidomonas sp., Strain RCC2347" /LENGTH=318 /DNA_ID=CAMNT_0043114363 /DNA_START=74 /DNA_END=1026 /DNA_ORIENTATION=-
MAPKHSKLNFANFVLERVRILKKRNAGEPAPWTKDYFLRRAKFCNIDRREDFVTKQLITELNQDRLTEVQKVQLIISLRFTSSRRDSVETFAQMILDDTLISSFAFDGMSKDHPIKCGSAYQPSGSREETGMVVEGAAQAVVDHIRGEKGRPFESISEAQKVLIEKTKKPDGKERKFSSAEAAKDLAYLPGFLSPGAFDKCRLGPGAEKGLSRVRKEYTSNSNPWSTNQALKENDHEACKKLLSDLKKKKELEWMRGIDVEQALCEFEKYCNHVENGISKVKVFPRGLPNGSGEEVDEAEENNPTATLPKGNRGKKRP